MGVARIVPDMKLGAGQTGEDIVISALVMAPFALTAVVLLGWMMPLAWPIAVLLFAAATAVGGLWNAGWRARTVAADGAEA